MTSSRVFSDWLPGKRANLLSELPQIVRVFLSTPASSTSSARSSAPESVGRTCTTPIDRWDDLARRACRYLIGSRPTNASNGASDE